MNVIMLHYLSLRGCDEKFRISCLPEMSQLVITRFVIEVILSTLSWKRAGLLTVLGEKKADW